MEVVKIVTAAKMLAEDDVEGAVATLEQLLHPGTPHGRGVFACVLTRHRVGVCGTAARICAPSRAAMTRYAAQSWCAVAELAKRGPVLALW